VLISGVDPRIKQLTYSLGEAIDGPSAGALLGVGSLVALRGSRISASTTMTGTVLPDGSVGPVGGVATKVQAAAAAGLTRVLIPSVQRSVLDPKTGRPIDPVKLGRSVGVEVKPVRSLADAYALMTGQPEQSSAVESPPIEPGVLRMLTRRSRALIAAAKRRVTELSSRAGGSVKSAPANITALLSAAERALARGDPVLAFAAAAEAAQSGQVAVASARLHAAARHVPLRELAAQVSRQAERSLTSIRAEVRANAELPMTRIAQLTALADTLAWGDFALTSIRIVQKRLKTVRTEAELDEIVRFLEVARFEAATYMPACAESLAFLRGRPMTDIPRTVGLLNAYTELIGYGAASNRTYADSLGLGTSARNYLGQLIAESDALTGAVSPEFRDTRGPTALPALRLSAALLEYVQTTQEVNDLTYRAGHDLPPNLEPIKEPATVRSEAQAADELAGTQIHAIAAAGLDPSFVQWNREWGADLAFRRLPDTTDEQALHGLQFQWFAVLQSRLVTALSRT
jgi:hypothetical protein